jgi:hypothetical protein
MFAALPAGAFLVWCAYRLRVPFYVPHLYFAIHVHAAAFFILATGRLVNFAARSMGASVGFAVLIFFLSLLAMFFSPLLALHRVYGGQRDSNFIRGVLLIILYFFALMFAVRLIDIGRMFIAAW